MSSPAPPLADPQATQAGLAVMLRQIIEVLFPQLDVTDLRGGLPAFTAAVGVQVHRHAQASAALAARQYAVQRRAAGVRGVFTPVPADPPPVQEIVQVVDWATQPLWSSAVLGGPAAETEQAAGSAVAEAKARLAAGTERMVLNAGGDTILDNVLRDRAAKGFVRLTEPDPCWLCAMLATRGVVYKDQSFNAANARFVPHPDFPVAEDKIPARAHDNCRCHVAPVFTAYEPTAQERQWEQVYRDAKPNPADGSPAKAKQVAFRRAYEGRTAPAR